MAGSVFLNHQKFLSLFRTTAEGDIEGDDGLGTIIHVHSLAELGIEECLLSGEHFEIVGLFFDYFCCAKLQPKRAARYFCGISVYCGTLIFR